MSLRKLASDTILYGISSILGRFINVLLVPLHTAVFSEAEYGILSDVFALTALLMVVFTYRMEVAYFRYGSDKGITEKTALNTSMLSIVASTIILAAILLPLAPQIAAFSLQEEHSSFYALALVILCVDAINEIPFSRLRLQGRPIRFAVIRLSSILLMFGLNYFFLKTCPYLLSLGSEYWFHSIIDSIYKPEFGIGYILVANLIGNLFATLLHAPSLFSVRLSDFDKDLWKKMIRYALPLVIVGFSYVINEVFDRKMIIRIAPGNELEREIQNGIYGGVYKLAMLIALFTQAFRYGAEPFFFKQKTADNAKQLYADIAKFFAIAAILGFLTVSLYIDVFKHILQKEEFWAGLHVVPILLMANLCIGLYYTLSVWFKITDRTQWGAYISVGGAVITITLNLIFIPLYSYTAAAWVTLICYASMLIANYIIGQRFYPVPYQVGRILTYIALAVGLFFIGEWVRATFVEDLFAILGLNSLLILSFIGLVFWREKESVRAYL